MLVVKHTKNIRGKYKMADKLSSLIQEDLLTILCFHKDEAFVIRNVVNSDLFEGVYRDVANVLYGYLEKFDDVPGDGLATVFDEVLDGDDRAKARMYNTVLHDIFEYRDNVNVKHVISRIQEFVRQQELKSGIIDASDAILSNEPDAVELAESILKAAMKKRDDLFYPGLFMDEERLIDFLKDENPAFPTGIKELDKYGIGPARKELFLLIAAAKKGKCILEGSLVTLDTGERKPIELICKEGYSRVVSLNDQTGEYVVTNIVEHYKNGKKPCYEVTTKSGRVVTVTGEHPFLTPGGWKNIKEIPVGGSIAVPRKFDFWGGATLSVEQVKFLAYMIAEGCHKGSAYSFTNNDPQIQKDFEHCVRSIGSDITWVDEQTCYIVNNKNKKHKHGKNPCKTFLDGLGLGQKKAIEKFIPEIIFSLTRELTSEFLSVLFSCDGSIYRSVVEYCSSSSRLIRDVSSLLTKFGIVHRLKKTKLSFVILIRDQHNIRTFSETINFYCSTKSERLFKLIGTFKNTNQKSFLDATPHDVVVELCKRFPSGELHHEDWQLIKQHARRGRGIGKPRSNLIVERNPIIDFGIFLNDNVLWDPIVSKKYIGKKETYDLTLDKHHNFIANDIIVHNTWFLIQLAKMAMLSNLKVCHITLEMSEERIAQRYMQSLFSLPKRQAEKIWRTKFIMDDDEEYVEGMKRVRMDKLVNFALDDPEVEAKLLREIRKFSGQYVTKDGLVLAFRNLLRRVVVRQFPTGNLTMGQLTAYLDSLERNEHFRPDLLILDYPDLMTIPGNDHRLGVIQLFKEIRGMCIERNMAGAIVDQSGKEGAKRETVQDHDIAEAWAKIANIDTALTYSQTAAEAKLGLGRLYVADNRNDKDKFSVLLSQNYALGQFAIQTGLMYEDYWGNVDGMEHDE